MKPKKKMQRELLKEVTNNAVKFPEVLKSLGIIYYEIERDPGGPKDIEGWEQLAKTTASKSQREEAYRMQPGDRMVGQGDERGCRSKEKGTRKIKITLNCGRVRGACLSQTGNGNYGEKKKKKKKKEKRKG